MRSHIGEDHARVFAECLAAAWKAKLKEGTRTFERDVYQFDVDQIGRILAARVHPSRR